MHFGSLSAQSTTDTLGRIQELHRQGQQQRKDYNFEQALKLLLQAYELSDSQAYNLPHLDIQLSLAQLHYDIQNFDRAALEAHTYIQLIKPFDFPDKKAQAHVLLGHIYAQNGKWEEAEIFLRMADQYYTANGNNTSRAQVLLGYGILSIKRQEYQSAINYLEAASLEFERNDQIELLALAELYKAEASIKINPQTLNNSLSIARTALKKARGLAQKHKLFKLTIEAYRLDSYLALRENQYVAAENSLMTYEQKSDSLYQSFVNTIASTYNGQQDLVSLTDIIDQQKNDLDKQQKSISFSKITTGLSIALIVILSLLTLSLYKNNNLRAKANELLQDKNNELQLAKEKAEKASLVKAQFLSTITHELRTPLYVVTGLTHLLLEENPKPEQKEHLNSLQFSGEYLLSLINNILDLNKLEANKVEVEKVTFQLKKRLNDVLIALKKSADDRKNTLRLEYDESIPDKIEGDSLKLSQIFINLIGNSLKFTQNGDVVVRVSKINKKDNKVTLRFEIEDNGVGISKKKQKSIFESFSQASLQINRKFGGTGLGLSIVKNLLELMGSRIQLDSELGKGSKFWFDLVLEVSTNEITGVAGETVLSEDEYNSLENRQVLVVEDNKINQMITRKILEKRKIVCQVADNGMDAIKMVQENDFDVVLMDIHMPGISGIEATQEIRKFNPELPIIALTAVTIDENLDEFYRVGFNEIIPKPFKTEEFFEKIHRTLEQSIASKET
jgi:signal transduction histidine kinase/ActR/RegA family two-component response regulator